MRFGIAFIRFLFLFIYSTKTNFFNMKNLLLFLFLVGLCETTSYAQAAPPATATSYDSTTFAFNRRAFELWRIRYADDAPSDVLEQVKTLLYQALAQPQNANQAFSHSFLALAGHTLFFDDLQKGSPKKKKEIYERYLYHWKASGFLDSIPVNKHWDSIEEDWQLNVLNRLFHGYPKIHEDVLRGFYLERAKMMLWVEDIESVYTFLEEFIATYRDDMRKKRPASIGDTYFAFINNFEKAAVEQKQIEPFIQWCDSALQYQKNYPYQVTQYTNLHYTKADVYYRTGKYNEAYAAIQQAYTHTYVDWKDTVVSEKNSFYNYLLALQILYAQERYEEIISLTNKTLKHHPAPPKNDGWEESQDSTSYASVWFMRAYALERTERYEEAVAAYTQTFAYDPNRYVAVAQRAWVRTILGEYEHAKTDYTQDFRQTGHSFGLEGRGRIHYLQGNYAEAIADFDRALAISSRQGYDAYTLLWRYLAHRKSGMNEADAHTHLRVGLSKLSFKQALYIHDVVLCVLGDKSEKEIIDLAATHPSNPPADNHCVAYFYLGVWHELNGDAKKARQYWARAVTFEQVLLIPHHFARKLLKKKP